MDSVLIAGVASTAGITRRKQEKEERRERARLEAEANATNDPKGKNAKAAAAAGSAQQGQEEEGEEEEEIGPSPSARAQVGREDSRRRYKALLRGVYFVHPPPCLLVHSTLAFTLQGRFIFVKGTYTQRAVVKMMARQINTFFGPGRVACFFSWR